MAATHRIFISFAIEDQKHYRMLAGQAKHEDTPFEFIDLGVKEPWDEKWKTNCRTRIKGCDGVIAMVSKNTAKAAGALWEVRCAVEEGIPVRGIYCTTDDRPASLPAEFKGVKVVSWTWPNIAAFLEML